MTEKAAARALFRAAQQKLGLDGPVVAGTPAVGAAGSAVDPALAAAEAARQALLTQVAETQKNIAELRKQQADNAAAAAASNTALVLAATSNSLSMKIRLSQYLNQNVPDEVSTGYLSYAAVNACFSRYEVHAG